MVEGPLGYLCVTETQSNDIAKYDGNMTKDDLEGFHLTSPGSERSRSRSTKRQWPEWLAVGQRVGYVSRTSGVYHAFYNCLCHTQYVAMSILLR